MMLSVPLFLSNVPQAFEGGRTRDAFSHISTLLIGAFPGIAAGVYVLDALPPQSLQIFVGATLMLVTTILVVAPRLTIPRTTSWPVATGVGFTSGFIGSPVAMPSGLVFTYLLAQGMRGAHFTKHASLFVMCSSAWLALALLAASGFDPVDLLISGLGILPVLAGMQLGQTLRDRIHANAFKWLVLAAVFGAAADLIRRGLTGA
jgi:uncharacterized membrane protein YfcA